VAADDPIAKLRAQAETCRRIANSIYNDRVAATLRRTADEIDAEASKLEMQLPEMKPEQRQ
jgi:hypothetical protein